MSNAKNTLKGLINKDEKVFEQFYNDYKNLLFFIIINIVRNQEAAKDLLQDSFIKIYNNVSNVKDANSLKSWCCMIAKNLSITYVNRMKLEKEKSIEAYYDSLNQGSYSSNYDEMINKWKDILTNEEIDIVVLHIVYDMKYKEIAATYETTTKAIEHRYIRAIEKIKAQAKKEGKL